MKMLSQKTVIKIGEYIFETVNKFTRLDRLLQFIWATAECEKSNDLGRFYYIRPLYGTWAISENSEYALYCFERKIQRRGYSPKCETA
jgi:hypothetical protein